MRVILGVVDTTLTDAAVGWETQTKGNVGIRSKARMNAQGDLARLVGHVRVEAELMSVTDSTNKYADQRVHLM